MGILLGIDYGDKRIGLAVSDPDKKLARRHSTLPNNQKTIETLKEIIREEGVEAIVLGIPVGFRGESAQTKKVEDFAAILEKELSIPIKRMNEIFTSKMAEENLTSSGTKNIKEILDQEAARIILQDYMNSLRPGK